MYSFHCDDIYIPDAKAMVGKTPCSLAQIAVLAPNCTGSCCIPYHHEIKKEKVIFT